MKKFLLAFFVYIVSVPLSAQLVVSDTLTAEQLAQKITGDNVTILSPAITCSEGAYGSFEASGISNFDPETGIILATGIIQNAIGPNNTESKSTSFAGSTGDECLETISGFVTKDACKFEFDIIPDGDTLRFDFSFASEEYSEYVCSSFNDVFGFFISGPGIVGDPGLGGKKNIALIPGTTTPVTINNVNGGNPTPLYMCDPTNPEYFVSNPLNLLSPIQYDGWTTDLFALAADLIPCEKYHLELIIADASDKLWDSGVFIEEIRSNNISVRTETVGGVDFMIEGCNPGYVIFERENADLGDLDITYFLQGTATNGVDYGPIGSTNPNDPHIITILNGENTDTLFIDPFADGIVEGIEYIDIIVGNPLCDETILDSVRFFIRDSLEIDVVGDPLVCSGDTVQLEAIADAVEYFWSPPFVDFFPSDTTAITNLVVEDDITIFASGKIATCITTVPYDIEVTTLELTGLVSDSICEGDNSGFIDITVTDGVPAYDFVWSGPNNFEAFTEDLTNLEAGTYTVTVTDSEGCSNTQSFTISSYNELELNLSPIFYVGGFNVSCNGASDGKIFAIASEGGQPYTYEWDDPGMSTGEILDGVPAGTYTVVATDVNGCSVTGTVTLTEPPPLEITIESELNSSCFGEQDGTISASVAGGNEPYQYFWYNSDGDLIDTDSIAENLLAGSYTLIVQDGNLCTDLENIVLEGPDAPVFINLETQINVSCFGGSDGFVVVSATGGTVNDPDDYTFIPNDTLTNLTAGEYLITATDLNNCSFTFPIVITEPSELDLTVDSQSQITCVGEDCALATLSVSGGTTPYDFLWDDGTTTINNQNLCLPGDYQAFVTDSLGCMDSVTVSITSLAPELSASFDITNVFCGGDTTGAIDLTVIGGMPPYNVVWDGGNCLQGPIAGEDLTEICAGEWCVIIEDANGCSFDTCVVVTENDPLEYFFEMTPADCFGAFTGDIDFSVFGGVAPYEFAWFGGIFPPANFDLNDTIATTEDLIDFPGAIYLVHVVDAVGCTLEREITITAPDDLQIDTLSISNYNGFEISCPLACDGAIDIDVTGGTVTPAGDYYYEWKEQAINFNEQGQGPAFQDQMDLCASADTFGYEVIVIDDNQCLLNAFFVMEAPDELQVDVESDSVSCSGFMDGSATATVIGGVPDYSYSWYSDNTLTTLVSSTNPASGLEAGEYYLVVSDANGCMEFDSIEVDTPNPLLIELFSPEFNGFNIDGCNGETNGFIAAAISGGSPGYDISWTQGSGGPVINTTDFQLENLAAGEYCLAVTDAMGCMDETCITLTEPDPIVVDADVMNITCSGDADGSINLTITGGVNPTTFWNDSTIADGELNPTGLEPGIYMVVVYDDNDCQESFTYEITQPLILNVAGFSPTFGGGYNITCNGDNNATIDVTVTGGTPDYSYDWDHLPGTSDPEDLSNLGPGTYTLIVTDMNSCTDTLEITVMEPEPLTVDISVLDAITCSGVCDGQLQTTVSGGIPAYTDFIWDFGFNGPITPDTLCVGNYSVTVFDINDCQATDMFMLDGPIPLDATANVTNVSCEGFGDGSIDLTVTGGTGVYTYLWTLGTDTIAMTEDISGLAPGEYCVDILDANECEFSECYTITEPDGMDVTSILSDYDGFNVTCGTECDGFIDLTVTGGTPPYTFDWSHLPGNMDPEDVMNLCAGPVSVTITDFNGCTVDLSFDLTQPSDLSVTLDSPVFPGGTNVSCVGDSTGVITSSILGGVTIDSIGWTLNGNPYPAGNGLPNITNLPAGTYVITVIDVNGCSATASITLTEPSDVLDAQIMPFVYPSGDNISCFGECDGSFDVNVTGGTPSYTLEWRDADGDVVEPFDLCAGIYTLVVLDTNMCFVTLEDTLFEPPLLELDTNIIGENFCSYDNLVDVDLTITGGSPSYQIDWNDPLDDIEDQTGLGQGNYTVVVTDANGCITPQLNINITAPDPIQIDSIVTDVSCNGFMDGSIDITVSGGTEAGDYDYDWSGAITSTDEDLNNLDVGVYVLVVQDDNMCVDSVQIDIDEPEELDVQGSASEAVCGGANGSVDITVSGGTSPYTYDWDNDGVFDDPEDLPNVFSGDTTVVVMDNNGCVGTLTINVPGIIGPLSLDQITEDVTCAGDANGSIVVMVNNGTPTFTYAWTDFPGVNSSTLQDLPGGTYEVTVTDDNDCTDTQVITISEPDSLEIDLSAFVYPNGTNLTTAISCDGAISSFVQGGTVEYSYLWTGSPNGVPNDTLPDAVGICEGEYCLTVTDENNCVADTCLKIEGPDELILPTGVSPNDDGLNDSFIIIGIDAYPENDLKIFNRWGNLVFEQQDYTNGDPWRGEGSNGEILPDATYFVILVIQNSDIELNGYVELRR